MEFVRFQDRIYAKTPRGILIWDSAWNNFRPLEKIVWNPQSKQVEPFFGSYCSEIFDVNYGYDSKLEYCVDFTDKYVDKTDDARLLAVDDFWRWTDQPLEWLQDRAVVLHPCASIPDRTEYLRVMNLRARTSKRIPRQLRGTFKQRKRE
jgi:hypothetical protein